MTGEYAHPETLVDVTWVQDNLGTANVRLVEVDVDPSLYEKGHIEGAVGWNWETDLCDPVRRDVLAREDFEKLCSAAGITPDTTVVLYGDSNNWFACWALWEFKLYGHRDVRLMNGGRVVRDRRPCA
jgi:thiosulfate/3-mercaptopyruvate sulfurtransferase